MRSFQLSPGRWRHSWRSVASVASSTAALALALVITPIPARATTVVPPDFSTLVNSSDFVVRVLVRSVHAEKRSGPPHDKIVTLVDVDVLEVIAGTAPQTLTLQFLGGRVGQEELQVSGMPEFAPGAEEVLFVQGNGRTICPLVHMMYGRYPILRDAVTGRATVLRHDGTALTSATAVAQPLSDATSRRTSAMTGALELDQFVAAIRSAINPQGPLSRNHAIEARNGG